MRAWAEKWKVDAPDKRTMVLIGPPGIGKTSSAEALAREMGWGIVEMNASDQRNGDAIRGIALRASQYNTFGADGSFMNVAEGGRKLVVLDEADSFYGNEDRGAMPAVSDLVRTAKQPVVLIVNDWYELSRRSSAVKNDTLQIKFKKPTAASVEKVLRNIRDSEKVAVEDEALSKIAQNTAGDLRAAVRDFQALATGNTKVTAVQASFLSGREERSDIYQFVDAVYRKRDPALARKLLIEADTDPGMASVWLDENMPYECHDTGELVRCSERLSRADIYLGRVGKRQYYGFWSYASDMMTEGITNAMRNPQVTHDRIRFPSYLTKMSRSKASRTLRNSLALKIGALTHTSKANVLAETLLRFRIMAENDPEVRVMLIRDAHLEPEELGFLLEEKMDSKAVKDAFKVAASKAEETSPKKGASKSKEPASESLAVTLSAVQAPPPAVTFVPEPLKSQKSLFDF